MPKSVTLLDRLLSARGVIASLYIVTTTPSQIRLLSFYTPYLHHLPPSVTALVGVLLLLLYISFFFFFFVSALRERLSDPDSWRAVEFDWESNCHFLSDKAMICPGGKERLDVSVDKWTQGQSWQHAAGDKMPPATGLYFYPASQQERCRSHIPEQQGFELDKQRTNALNSIFV